MRRKPFARVCRVRKPRRRFIILTKATWPSSAALLPWPTSSPSRLGLARVAHWLFIHLMYIVEFQSRVLVFIQWGFEYLTFNRGARLITALATEIFRGPLLPEPPNANFRSHFYTVPCIVREPVEPNDWNRCPACDLEASCA